jgi:7-cyano-7-deazaguanine synthase in queuosine biosynthesis
MESDIVHITIQMFMILFFTILVVVKGLWHKKKMKESKEEHLRLKAEKPVEDTLTCKRVEGKAITGKCPYCRMKA